MTIRVKVCNTELIEGGADKEIHVHEATIEGVKLPNGVCKVVPPGGSEEVTLHGANAFLITECDHKHHNDTPVPATETE